MSEPVKTLNPMRLKPATSAYMVYAVNAEAGVTPEDVAKPEYWAHVAKSLTAGDIVVARAEDLSWLAEYLVQDVGQKYARLATIAVYRFGAPSTGEVEAQDFYPKWNGPNGKWAVVRDKDKAIIATGLAAKEDALVWISNHRKTV